MPQAAHASSRRIRQHGGIPRDDAQSGQLNGSVAAQDPWHVDRGYEMIDVKLRNVGADIVRRSVSAA